MVIFQFIFRSSINKSFQNNLEKKIKKSWGIQKHAKKSVQSMFQIVSLNKIDIYYHYLSKSKGLSPPQSSVDPNV